MKLSVQSADLEAILTAANAVSKSASPIQIIAERHGEPLSTFGPDTEDRAPEVGQIRIIAFNDSIVSEWRRPAEIRRAGSVAIQPDGLAGLVKTSKGSDATFILETAETDNDQALRLTTSRSAHEFPSESEAIFSSVVPGHVSGQRADLSHLARAIDVAKVAAASPREVAGAKIALSGIHLRKREDMIDIVGTDGKRLALTTLHQDELGAVVLGPSEEQGITLPQEGIGLVTNMLASGPAHFAVLENNVIVETSDGSLSIRLIDTAYPNYTMLLGRPTTDTIELPKADLEIALQRSSVTLAKDKRTVAVKLSRGADGILVSSAAAGQSSSECLSEVPGEEVMIGFDARFMLGAIGVFGKCHVSLAFSDNVTPIQVTSAARPEITMLVMPCKTA